MLLCQGFNFNTHLYKRNIIYYKMQGGFALRTWIHFKLSTKLLSPELPDLKSLKPNVSFPRIIQLQKIAMELQDNSPLP